MGLIFLCNQGYDEKYDGAESRAACTFPRPNGELFGTTWRATQAHALGRIFKDFKGMYHVPTTRSNCF